MKAIFEQQSGARRRTVTVRQDAGGLEIRDSQGLLVARWRSRDLIEAASVALDGGRVICCRADTDARLIVAGTPAPPLVTAAAKGRSRAGMTILAVVAATLVLLAARIVG